MMKALLSTIILFSILLNGNCQDYKINSFVNLRMNGKLKKTEDIFSVVISTIPKGSRIQILEYATGGVYKVKYRNQIGFMNDLYFVTNSTPPQTFSQSKKNESSFQTNKSTQSFKNEVTLRIEGKVKKTEHILSDVIFNVPKGRKVQILEHIGGGIYKIKYGNIIGYMNDIYFSKEHQYTERSTTEKVKINDFPPILKISNIKFADQNNNNLIEGNENCYISFDISNTGKGSAKNLTINIENISNVKGLVFSNPNAISEILPNKTQKINIPIKGSLNLTTGNATIKVIIEEKFGFSPEPFVLNIGTKEFLKPNLIVTDYTFKTENGIISLGLPISLNVLIQNIGNGIAENVNVYFSFPNENVFPNGPKEFSVGNLKSGESKELVFEFIANRLYAERTIPITSKLSEKYGQFSENKQMVAKINSNTTVSTINISSVSSIEKSTDLKDIKLASLKSDVDKNIPRNSFVNPYKIALIIGNENYSSRQRGLSSEVDVAYAVNDALIFKEYCQYTLGVDEKNIFLLTNATSAEMNQKIELVAELLIRLGKSGELIFFYAGHGHPDEKTRAPYLIPVDVNASNLSSAIKLYDIYKRFSETDAKKISVFLDACFSGGGRETGLIAARAVRVRPREENIFGNMIVFAATSEDQSALPYHEKQHGMFTYFLLKKLQETKGFVDYGTLEDYLRKNVSIESLRVNHKAQDPKTNVSPQAKDIWESWKFQ